MHWVEYQTEEKRGEWGTWNRRRRHAHVFGGENQKKSSYFEKGVDERIILK